MQNHMLTALDDAMMRIFSPQQTEAERRADLEQQEDEFVARKEMEKENGEN
jgi:hypothetical protein